MRRNQESCHGKMDYSRGPRCLFRWTRVTRTLGTRLESIRKVDRSYVLTDFTRLPYSSSWACAGVVIKSICAGSVVLARAGSTIVWILQKETQLKI